VTTNLHDAVVVVTGGATGIGRALAREAVQRGARVMILDIVDAHDALDELRAAGGEVDAHVVDVTDIESVRAGLAATLERFGRVNVVCNNVGLGVIGRLQDTDPAEAARLIQLNIGGAFNVVHAFAPSLQQSAAAGSAACLLNTGSEHSLGVRPYVPPISVYTVTKYAVLGLTMTAHRDLSPEGISVSMLAPGWTRTENIQALIDSDPDTGAIITPYVQEPSDVAARAFDGLLAGVRVIATNSHSREFAMEHARKLMADIQRLPKLQPPADQVHSGSDDASKCPVVGVD